MKSAILYGGSFDPVHKGHLKIIEELAKLDVDKVIVIPNYLNPFKDHFSADGKLRLKWLKKVIKNPKVEISDYEIKRNQVCYTVDTIEHFSKQYDKLYFVIGADNLKDLDKWKNIEKLKELVEFIVVKRDNIKINKKYKVIDVSINISSTKIRNGSGEEYIPDEIKDEVIKFYSNYKKESI